MTNDKNDKTQTTAKIPELDQLETIDREKINAETAKIKWSELQRYFASGKTFQVADDLDLVEVALQCSADNAARIQDWQKSGQFTAVSDEQAQEWIAADASVWAVVVKPLILVQSVKES